MTNSKSTRRALVMSLLAIFMCVTMLVGTTFAWFTDTASTAVNKIQAGTLDVALEMYEDGNWVSAEGKTLNFKKINESSGVDTTTEVLWEPGCTYDLPELRIVNNGNLALKYKVVITGINGNAKLNEAIEWTIGDVAMGTEQYLLAGESHEFTISGHMKESAGNEYQGLSIDGIAITVYATQYTYEYDSNGNQYDAGATHYINNSSKKNGTVYNATKVTLDDFVVEHEYNGSVPGGMAFYLCNGAELIINDMDFSTTVNNNQGNRYIGFYVYNGSKLTINSGNFVMNGDSSVWNAFIWAQGGANGGPRSTVTINGGTFTIKGGNNSTIVNAYSFHSSTLDYSGSDVYITGGFFDLSDANPNVTLQWKSDCTMIVTGGTFVNYNPADHGVVPACCKVESQTQSDGKTWYTVVPRTETTVTTDTTFDMRGQTITLDSVDVPYVMTSDNSGAKITLKNVTYTGEARGIYFGEYNGSSGSYNFNTQADNVTVKDLSVSTHITNGSNLISAGVWVYGKFELNNCNMSGTTTTQTDCTPYDVVFVNQSNGTVNGGKYDSMFVYTHSLVTLKGVKVDKIACMTNTVVGKALTIDKDCVIDTIEFVGSSSYVMNLVIENGATINTIKYGGNTYTVDTWNAYVASIAG